MSKYEPELGQAAFGQPCKEWEASDLLIAALHAIEARLAMLMGNIHQVEYATPFENSGAKFKCDRFEAEAYSWGNEAQPFNFKWRDIEVSWYKCLGRGTSVNRDVRPNEIEAMLEDCLAGLAAYGKQHNEFHSEAK
jgi:hypothetical protein